MSGHIKLQLLYIAGLLMTAQPVYGLFVADIEQRQSLFMGGDSSDVAAYLNIDGRAGGPVTTSGDQLLLVVNTVTKYPVVTGCDVQVLLINGERVNVNIQWQRCKRAQQPGSPTVK